MAFSPTPFLSSLPALSIPPGLSSTLRPNSCLCPPPLLFSPSWFVPISLFSPPLLLALFSLLIYSLLHFPPSSFLVSDSGPFPINSFLYFIPFSLSPSLHVSACLSLFLPTPALTECLWPVLPGWNEKGLCRHQ